MPVNLDVIIDHALLLLHHISDDTRRMSYLRISYLSWLTVRSLDDIVVAMLMMQGIYVDLQYLRFNPCCPVLRTHYPATCTEPRWTQEPAIRAAGDNIYVCKLLQPLRLQKPGIRSCVDRSDAIGGNEPSNWFHHDLPRTPFMRGAYRPLGN